MSKRHKTLLALFKRDGGWCRLCGLPVERKHDNPKLRATIDHIIPRSKGGGNNLENLQVAHAGCNYEKADNLEGEQE